MTEIRPLITAAEAYPQMEALAVAAKRRIWLSFRVFDTTTALRDDAARDAAEGEDWAALLVACAARGVDVRLQVADFDPIAALELHGAAWASLRRLNDVSAGAAQRIEAIAARHPARLGALVALALSFRTRRERREVAARYGDRLRHALPRFHEAARAFAPRLHPASHHHKLAIFDDAAIIGGLDVDERRWDTPEHDRLSAETWRDATLLAPSGGDDVGRVFATLWNASIGAERRPPARPEGLGAPTRIESAGAETGDGRTEIVLTRSEPSRNPFSFGPRPVTTRTLDATLAMIASARRFLYVETQFLRSRRVAEALAEAARRTPDLNLVVVLPFAPERFAFKGRRDTAMKHA